MTQFNVVDVLRPTCILRVGFVGHRSNRLPKDLASVKRALNEVFGALAAESKALLAKGGGGLYRNSQFGPAFRLTASLAPGSDRVATRIAQDLGWQTQVVLPRKPIEFLREQAAVCSACEEDSEAEFQSLLSRADSTLVIDGDGGGHRRNAHELVGRVVVEQSDVLVAVWDGEPAEGLGGTAHVVREALSQGVAVVQIPPHGGEPQYLLPGEAETLLWQDFQSWLKTLMLLPEGLRSEGHVVHEATALERWHLALEEAVVTSRFPPLYQLLLRLGGKGFGPWTLSFEQSKKDWAENWEAFGRGLGEFGGSEQQEAYRRLQDRFHLFDHWAECYGRRYRASYLAIYLLAFVATCCGLVGVFLGLPGKTLWVVLELILIFGVIGLVHVGRQRYWHERWLDYRAVAEQLRHARLGLWTGLSFEPASVAGEGAASAWTGWYIRACARELPMPTATIDSGYCRLALVAIQDYEVKRQRDFNQSTERVQHTLHHRFEGWEEWLLRLLVVIGIAFLVFAGVSLGGLFEADEVWVEAIKSVMSFVGIFVPALGAVLLGMRAQGDFLAYSERARETAAHLESVDQSIIRRMDIASKPLRFEDLIDATDASVAALSTDVFAWRSVYRRKSLSVAA